MSEFGAERISSSSSSVDDDDEDNDETLRAEASAAASADDEVDENVEDQTYRYASERWRRWRQRIIDRIDPKNLNNQQKQLLSTRKRIFEYLDRLSTYECILGRLAEE